MSDMRAFAQAWPNAEFVQGVLARLPWFHHISLLEKLEEPHERSWYAEQAVAHNWSRNVLVMHVETRQLERQGRAITDFAQVSAGSEIVQQPVGRLPWNAVDRRIKDERDEPTIGLLLCKSKNKVVAEYALRDNSRPLGIADYQLIEALPEPLQTNLPTIEQIERELEGASS